MQTIQNDSILNKNAQQEQEYKQNSSFDFTSNHFDIDFSKELKDKIEKNPNFKPYIRYNKEPFNTLIFTNFTAFDFNLFMCFCFAAKDKRNLSIKLSFDDLEFLIGKVSKNGKQQKIDKNPARLFTLFDEFCEKAAKIVIKQTGNNKNSYTHLFDNIDIYKERKIIVIRFNALMVKALNDFTKYFTEFELQQYCNLKSKYSKQLYSLLMDTLYIGKRNISKDELICYFSLKDKNIAKREDNFYKVILERAVLELKPLFKDFQFNKEYVSNGKSNRKIIAYNFIYSR